MMNKKIGVLLLFALLVSFGAKAQRATSMRINEVLVVNEDNFVDEYDKRHAWIELFNNSAGSVNIAGCFLTNDKNNPKKYPIPKGDVLTIIPPRQHTLFWADGEPNRGTFHVNFTLDPSKENYVALYDADGKGSLGGSSAGAGDRERLLHRGTGTDWTETGICGIRQQPGGRSVGNGDCTVKGCTGDHLCGD